MLIRLDRVKFVQSSLETLLSLERKTFLLNR